MTDTGEFRTLTFCADPNFTRIEQLVDKIAAEQKHKMSRSTLIRTMVYEYSGFLPDDIVEHQMNVGFINRALGRK